MALGEPGDPAKKKAYDPISSRVLTRRVVTDEQLARL
jgi:hypothetical protein